MFLYKLLYNPERITINFWKNNFSFSCSDQIIVCGQNREKSQFQEYEKLMRIRVLIKWHPPDGADEYLILSELYHIYLFCQGGFSDRKKRRVRSNLSCTKKGKGTQRPQNIRRIRRDGLGMWRRRQLRCLRHDSRPINIKNRKRTSCHSLRIRRRWHMVACFCVFCE